MEFVVMSLPPLVKKGIKTKITKMGGKVVTAIKENIMAVISTPQEVERMGSRMSEVKNLDIHVVGEDFVKEAEKNVGKIPDLIIKKSICSWGGDVSSLHLNIYI